jgi:internalin A
LSHVLKRWRATEPGESWLRLEYPFLHGGQVERIIVALSGLSEGRDWWRDGLVIEDPATDCSLLLDAVPRERYIDVRLRDGHQADAFARVRTALHKLLERPPSRTLVSLDGTTFVELTAIVEARREGRKELVTAARKVAPREPYDRFLAFANVSESALSLVPEQPATEPTRIFISWSQSPGDRPYLEALETRLKGLKRLVAIDFWHGGRVFAGADVADEKYKRLEVADVVLLLVSPDFMASDECYSTEMQHALKKYDEGRGRVVPILVRSTDAWNELPIGRHQPMPRDGRAISQRPEREQDEAWAEVSRGLRALLEAK